MLISAASAQVTIPLANIQESFLNTTTACNEPFIMKSTIGIKIWRSDRIPFN